MKIIDIIYKSATGSINGLPAIPEFRFKELSEKLEQKSLKEYECADCKELNYIKNNGEITVGFCNKCGHPLLNEA
jgi:ribosomal protein L37AE/L43A